MSNGPVSSVSSQSPTGANPAPNPSGQEPARGVAVPGGQGKDAPVKTAPTIEQLKAARASRAVPAPANQPNGSDPAKQGSEQPGQSGTVQTPAPKDPALEQFVSLRKQIESLEAKTKETEPALEQAKTFGQIQELIKAGKHYDAIALLGKDVFDNAVKQVTGQEITSDEPGKPSPELEALRAELDKVKSDLKAKEDAETKARVEAEREQGRQSVVKYVKDQAKDFPYLSRSESWINAALKDAETAYESVVKELKRELNEDEKNDLITRSLKAAEQFRTEEGKLYGANSNGLFTPPARHEPAPSITSDFRGNTQGRPVTVGKMTLEQVKMRRRPA